MIYYVNRMRLTEKARRDLKGFWQWLEQRERWFYRDLGMVRGVRWYQTQIGELYTLECWAAFDDLAGLGDYRKVLSSMKADDQWEAERTSQDDWWHFIDSRVVADPPCAVGFGPMGKVADATRGG
jgi:hypothetical protein